MPADNGSGCHLDERFLPSSPAPSQYDPEQLVWRSESPARALGVKSEQLLTQGKIFEDDILAGPECTNNPAEEVPEPYDHAQNLTGTLSIELGAKSLILRVCLANCYGELILPVIAVRKWAESHFGDAPNRSETTSPAKHAPM